MDRGLAVLLTAAVGALVATQAPVNARLSHAVGRLPAASISFAVGTVILVVLALAAGGGYGKLSAIKGAPWWALGGGLLGAAYVTCVLITVQTLGAGGVTAATIAGQLTMALLIDQFGIAGVVKQPITASRAAGVILLGLGTFLIVRE
jgi:transporter family-2 protein